MESRREKSSSGEIFSFPSTPVQDQDSDFEFGSITPDSPSTFNNSPADHLFVNGRLLPHSFPPQPIGVYAAVDRTSSVGSKDSIMSSRSNSSNSRSSSSCGSSTSARTSSSDSNYNGEIRSSRFSSHQKKSQKSSVSAQVYGSSQRWQFIASVPVPATLSRENSRRKKAAAGVEKIGGIKSELRRKKRQTEKARKKKKKKKKKNMWFGRKVFRWIILVCKECHAIEPSRKSTKSTSTTKPKSY